MVRIAIVYSGIDYNKNVFNQFVVSGIRITRSINGNIVKDDKINDENGHGTLSASVIYKECPNAFVHIIKIFEDNLEADIEILEVALEHILDIPIDIVNLSLAFPPNNRSKKLNEICKKIHKQGKVIISSVFNGKYISQPASFKSVIGVRGMLLNDENTILFNSKKEQIAL